MNFFRDFLLPGQEKPGRFPTVFGLSAGFRLALARFELNLTSDDSRIYHYRRWDEVKLVLKRSFGQRSRKGVSNLLLAYH